MPALVARRPWLIAAISLGLIVAVLLGGRAAWRLGRRLKGPPPRQTDVALIADWMSVPYISRAYRVPEEEVHRALGTKPEGRRVRPLRQIAEETGRTPDEVVEVVRQTVATWQAEHPRPPPGRPGPAREGPGPGRDGPKPDGSGTRPGDDGPMPERSGAASGPKPSGPLPPTGLP